MRAWTRKRCTQRRQDKLYCCTCLSGVVVHFSSIGIDIRLAVAYVEYRAPVVEGLDCRPQDREIEGSVH